MHDQQRPRVGKEHMFHHEEHEFCICCRNILALRQLMEQRFEELKTMTDTNAQALADADKELLGHIIDIAGDVSGIKTAVAAVGKDLDAAITKLEATGAATTDPQIAQVLADLKASNATLATVHTDASGESVSLTALDTKLQGIINPVPPPPPAPARQLKEVVSTPPCRGSHA